MESPAGGEPCGEPAISHDSHHVSLVQWTNLFASRHKCHRFTSPGGYLCETGILLLALSRYKMVFYSAYSDKMLILMIFLEEEKLDFPPVFQLGAILGYLVYVHA